MPSHHSYFPTKENQPKSIIIVYGEGKLEDFVNFDAKGSNEDAELIRAYREARAEDMAACPLHCHVGARPDATPERKAEIRDYFTANKDKFVIDARQAAAEPYE